MRILFLSHYFPPEINAPASRTFEHCKIWAEHGHDITVLTNVPNHPAGKIFPGYRNWLWQRDRIAGISVFRLFTLVAANRAFLLRTMNYFFYMLMSIAAAPFLPKADVVISTSPQFFCGIAGYFVSRIKRTRWVLEIRDIWPESIVAVGAMKKSFWIRFLEWMEAFAYRNADTIVIVSEGFREHVEARAGASSKVAYIPNGVDLAFFNPEADGKEIIRETRLQGKFVVTYIGTFGMAHGLETILEAAELLRDTQEVAFLLVGDGAERDRLLRRQDELGLSNVVIMDQQPKRRMPAVWAAASASVVLLRDRPVFRLVIPSKMFESMAMRRPIILGVKGESQRILEASGAGQAIQPEDPIALARIIREWVRSPELLIEMGSKGRSFVEANYSRKVLATEFEDLLEALVADTQPDSAGA